MLAHGGIDALDPERAEIALLDATVARCVLHRAVDGGLCGPDRVLAAAAEALGCVENLLVLGVGGDAPFHTCHVMISLKAGDSLRDRSADSSDDLAAVRLGKDHGGRGHRG